jgi:hypothetical protein
MIFTPPQTKNVSVADCEGTTSAASCAPGCYRWFAVDWSGKRLLFVGERVNSPRWNDEIFLIDRDGSHEKTIGEGRWPDSSPDGKEIVYIAKRPGDQAP